MRILITGGLGYIGSHLTLKCIQNDDFITIVDNESTCSKYTRENLGAKHAYTS